MPAALPDPNPAQFAPHRPSAHHSRPTTVARVLGTHVGLLSPRRCAKDFGYAPAAVSTLNATYDATAKTISGSISEGTQTVTLSGGPIAGSLYNYNTAAALTTVVGSWSTTSLTGEGVAINVASTGAFTAASSLGCNFTGTITPRASGKNVFNVAMTFGAAPCALPGQSATGIALAYPLTSGRTQLLVSAVDGTRSYGASVFGTR